MRISDWSSDVCSSDLQHPFDIHDAGADGCQFGDDLLGRGRWRGRVRKRRDASFHAALKHGVDADALLFGKRAKRLVERDRQADGVADQPQRPSPPRQRSAVSENRSEEHTSELQSLMRISYAVFCLKKKKTHTK